MSKELIAYLARELRGLHGLYERVMTGLDEAQVNHVPEGGNQNIAFCLWHYVRTEDNIVQFVIQRKPTVWIEDGWDAKFGLDSKAQGTGFSDDDARNFRIRGLDDFLQYMRDVFRRTEDYVAALDEGEAERRITVKPVGEMSIQQCISGMCLTHGYRHLGEIEFAKGLTGTRGSSTGY
ncbi:MAG TPA: DinB family protein [Dehalococcoidia bacterium]|jgi:hypothetical protein|nr:DinB family protein [Dehalococcoidia bacterium]